MPRRPGSRPTPVVVPALEVHLDRNHPRAAVARLVARGEWLRVRRGAYVERAAVSADQHIAARQLSLARADSLRCQLTVPHAASHASAAVAWGLPLLDVPSVAHVVQATLRAGDAADDVVRHFRPGWAADAVVSGERTLTSCARTTVDCLLTMGPAAGLVVADGAAALGVDLALCADLLKAAGPVRGVAVAREVLALADDGAESPGETLTRWAVLQAGLPAPTTQVEIATHLGTFWADLGWPEWRLALEYDGRGKYLASVGEALLREKRRHDAVQEVGWRIIRVAWPDVRTPDGLVRRVLKALPRDAVGQLVPRRLLAQPGW